MNADMHTTFFPCSFIRQTNRCSMIYYYSALFSDWLSTIFSRRSRALSLQEWPVEHCPKLFSTAISRRLSFRNFWVRLTSSRSISNFSFRTFQRTTSILSAFSFVLPVSSVVVFEGDAAAAAADNAAAAFDWFDAGDTAPIISV
jgi:hypothetical protein